MELKLLDLFSGIAGFSYAGEKIVGGFKTTQFVEKDSYCQSVIRKNFPNIPIHDDIRTFTAKRGQFDVFTIGFPCQDLSVAGRQRGINDETRSGLFYESIRLLREVRPKFALFENVRNLLSHEKGETFQEVLFQIAKAGYDAEWSIISAKDMGACHLRERIWIIAYPNESNRREGKIFENTSNEGWETSSNRGKSIQSKNRETCSDNIRQSNTAITNSDSDGSSSSTRIRLNGKTNSSSQKGKNEISKFEGGSESEVSEIIQYSSKWRNPKQRLDPNWTRYVSKPSLCRGDDGLSNRILRLKALGNSIVPQCAAVPLQRIKDLNKELC